MKKLFVALFVIIIAIAYANVASALVIVPQEKVTVDSQLSAEIINNEIQVNVTSTNLMNATIWYYFEDEGAESATTITTDTGCISINADLANISNRTLNVNALVMEYNGAVGLSADVFTLQV